MLTVWALHTYIFSSCMLLSDSKWFCEVFSRCRINLLCTIFDRDVNWHKYKIVGDFIDIYLAKMIMHNSCNSSLMEINLVLPFLSWILISYKEWNPYLYCIVLQAKFQTSVEWTVLLIPERTQTHAYWYNDASVSVFHFSPNKNIIFWTTSF